MGLILASQSPRRQKLLDLLQIDYRVKPAVIDEAIGITKPDVLVKTLALNKANNVAKSYPEDYILAADTVVCLGEKILGKPKNAEEAYASLSLLSGKTHQVLTGVALIGLNADFKKVITVITEVDFREIRPGELDFYIKTKEPFDKAGGYGIQGFAGVFVTAIRGSYHNVVGLPLAQTAKLLGEAGLYSMW